MKLTIIKWFLIWRVFLFVPLQIGFFLLPYKQNSQFTNIWAYTKEYFPLNNPIFYPWANFDGVHYLSIAAVGYTFDGRFFPLYPLLIRFFSLGGVSFGSLQFLAAFLIANLATLAGLIILYKLIRFDYSAQIAKTTLLYLLVFPTSFFFGSLYAEGLFLFLLASTFYLSRKHHWSFVGLCLLLLLLTRPTGIIMFPIMIYEILKEENLISKFRLKKLSSRELIGLLSILLSPVGLVGYAYFCLKKWGDALYFIHAQGDVSNHRLVSLVLFPQTLIRYSKILFTTHSNYFEWWIALLELLTFLFVSYVLFLAWKKKIRSSYLLFSLMAFLIPASTGTFSGLPRYCAVLFPVFLTLALLKSSIIRFCYIFVSVGILFVLLMFFSRGYYVS